MPDCPHAVDKWRLGARGAGVLVTWMLASAHFQGRCGPLLTGSYRIVGFIIRLIISSLIAVALGLGSAYYAVSKFTGQAGEVQNGPWRSSLTAGGADADMYTRARVALFGLLALNKSETIYYTATSDSAGKAFNPACAYRIEGRDPDTRWWSLTAYGRDSYLIPNEGHRYAVSKNNVVRSTDGTFVVRLSTTPEAQNWIATSKDGFDVTLRLYNPGPSVIASSATVELPSITKEACE